MGFKASTAVDPFDYDLAPYADAKGTVPEPSDAQVREFYAGVGTLLEDVLGTERLQDILGPEGYAKFEQRDPEAMMKVQAATNNVEDMEKAQERMLDLHAAVCSNHPSREDLEKLPYRVKQALYGALQRWLSPEASRPATNT